MQNAVNGSILVMRRHITPIFQEKGEEKVWKLRDGMVH